MPEFKLEATEVSGQVQVKTDTESHKLKQGTSIKEGATVTTESGGTAALTVPGISYLQVDTGTKLHVNKLKQTTEKEGILLTEEKVLKNEINLKLDKGQLKNSLRQREQTSTEFDLETPSAVAGIRGTSYECEVTSGGRTTCGVLEGKVRFSSIERPEAGRTLEANEKSSLGVGDTEPGDPQQMSEEETKDLEKFKQKAEKQLRLKPFIANLELNGQALERSGQGVYKTQLNYSEKKTLVLSGEAGAREENAQLKSIQGKLFDQELPIEASPEWEVQFSIEPPEEGEKLTLSGKLVATDSLDQRSRSYPLRIVLVHPEQQGALPVDLQPGKVPVKVNSIGGQPVETIDFPFTVTSEMLNTYSWQQTTDTGVKVGRSGLRVTGTVETDSPVGGVAFRLTPEGDWQLAPGKKEWSFLLNRQALISNRILEPEVVAWTEGGKQGTPVSFGQFNYSEVETVIPVNYNEGDVQLKLDSINGQRVNEFPHEIKTTELHGEGITVTGQAEADSPIQGVAYRVNGGKWEPASGQKNWNLELPLPSQSTTYQLEVIAWTAGEMISPPVEIGPIEYQHIETILPVTYSQGQVPVTFETLAGQSVAGLEFPYELQSTEVEGGKIKITGSATGDSPIAGVAVRVNGGNWTKIGETKQWAFTLPGSESGEFTVEARAWTTGQVLGKIHELGPVDYKVVETIPPSTYETGKVSVNFTRVAGFNYSEAEFPLQTYREDLSEGELVVEGTAEGEADIEGVAYSTDGGASWQLATGGANWSFSLPVEGSINFDQLQVIAWTTAGIVGEAVPLETINHHQIKYSTELREQFQAEWEAFTSENTGRMLENYGSNFFFQDEVTGEQMERSEYERFLENFFGNVRNLTVSYNINQIFASQNGGEISFQIEWRGTAEDPNRPFVIFGENCQHGFTRQADGSFELTTFEDLPLVLYLFHKEAVQVPDLGGIGIRNLVVLSSTTGADLLAECNPGLLRTNYAYLDLGGDIKDGGLKKLTVSDFSAVSSISSLGSGYTSGDSTTVQAGEFYAVNLRHTDGTASTALVKIIEVTANHIEIQIISAQSPPGIEEKVHRSFRGVDPF